MTYGDLREKLSREVHLSWKHIAYIGAGVFAWAIAVSATTAVHSSRIADHQKVLDDRAPAVTELARVGEQVRNEAIANAEFRRNDEIWKRRIEDKLDRALEQ